MTKVYLLYVYTESADTHFYVLKNPMNKSQIDTLLKEEFPEDYDLGCPPYYHLTEETVIQND